MKILDQNVLPHLASMTDLGNCRWFEEEEPDWVRKVENQEDLQGTNDLMGETGVQDY